MNCARARGLFGACWDDEITQAEREALEAHFAACPGCRAEYDEYSRALELVVALPRVAAWSAHGTIAALVAGVPAAIVLSAGGGARVPQASASVLAIVLAVAYLVGVGYAIAIPALSRPERD